MLRLDINLVFTIINVLLLLVVVRIFLLKPIRKIIAARQEEADAALAEANAAKEEAEKQQAEVQEQMKGIEAERTKVLAETRAKAGKEYERVLEDAKKKRMRSLPMPAGMPRKTASGIQRAGPLSFRADAPGVPFATEAAEPCPSRSFAPR